MAPPASSLVVAAAALGAFFVTLSSVRILAELAAAQHGAAVRGGDPGDLAFASQTEWHSVEQRPDGHVLRAQAKLTQRRSTARDKTAADGRVKYELQMF